MVRVLTSILLTIPIALSSPLAGDYYISHRPVFSSDGQVSLFTPLRSTEHAVAGFVMVKSDLRTVSIQGNYRWSGPNLQSESPIRAIAARTLSGEDSLAVYVVSQSDDIGRLTRFDVTPEHAELVAETTFDLTLSPTEKHQPAYSLKIFEALFGEHDPIALCIDGLIPAPEAHRRQSPTQIAWTYLYTADLARQLRTWPLSLFTCDSAQLFSVTTTDNRPTIDDPFSLAAPNDCRLEITDARSELIDADYLLPYSEVAELQSVELTARYEGNETLIFGRTDDPYFASIANTGRQTITALAESSGRIFELWQEPFENVSSIAPFLWQDQLVVVKRHHAVLFIDPTTGFTNDSILLPESLTEIEFYRLRGQGESLQLAGLAEDSMLKVFRVDPPVSSLNHAGRADDTKPITFELLPSYPNPFNGSTQLRFNNKETQHLALRIFNVLGQEIAVMAESILPPGDYDFTWDATDNFGEPQPTGIYFAQLKSETESHIIKLIYLK